MRRRGVAGCCPCGAAPPDGALYTARNTIRGELCSVLERYVGGWPHVESLYLGGHGKCMWAWTGLWSVEARLRLCSVLGKAVGYAMGRAGKCIALFDMLMRAV